MSPVQVYILVRNHKGDTERHHLTSRSTESPGKYALSIESTDSQEELLVKSLDVEVNEDNHAALLCSFL